MEAQPTGHSETVRAPCGKPFRLKSTDFVGTIEFHGEEGFTEAQAQRTPLRYDLLARLVCPGFSDLETFSAIEPGARLKVAGKDGPKLQVSQNHPGAPVRYEAKISEQIAGVAIRRSVVGHFGGDAFSFNSSLTKASFDPGVPFSGAATYVGFHPSRGTHVAHGTWRGNLSVDFPGHAGVPLTGPGFKAAIVRAKRTESSR